MKLRWSEPNPDDDLDALDAIMGHDEDRGSCRDEELAKGTHHMIED